MFQGSKSKKAGGVCYGTTIIGERGQIVIPAEARRTFGLKPKDKLLVFGMGGKFLSLLKAEQVQEMMFEMAKRLKTMSKVLKESKKKRKITK